MDKKDKRAVTVILVIAAIVLINVVISALYRPVGLTLIADKYAKAFQVEKRLEKQYDDKFRLVGSTVDMSDLLDGLKPVGYNYIFKSEKCGNKSIYVDTDFKLEKMYDNYLYSRYKDEAKTLIEKSLGSYFGEGHYCYYIYTTDDEKYYNSYIKNPDIYYYIGHDCMRINIITDKHLDAKNKGKIQNEIIDNLNSTFDTTSTYIDVDILFDKDDDTALPEKKELTSNEYFNYRDLDYWSDNLEIENDSEGFSEDYSEEYFTDLKAEWKTNDRKRFKYQTKNEFLNGADTKVVINGFEFIPDGSVTLGEFLNKTGYVYCNNTVKAKNFNPNDVVLTEIGKKNDDPKVYLEVVNKTGKDTEVENGSVYSISIGLSHEVETELFSDCSICGLKVGDAMTEEDLVKLFGPYEEMKNQGNGETRYDFVDGTEIGYATRDSYRKKLSVIIQNGQIRYISCAYYEPDNRYVSYRDD